MAVSHNLPLLRHFWIQLPLQYDLHLPILQVETFYPRQNQLHVLRMLEEGSFRGKSSDFVMMFLFGAISMITFAFFVNLLFLGQAFTIMLVYVWARRNPYIRWEIVTTSDLISALHFSEIVFVRMNFFGLLTFNAPYLPWVLLGFSLLLGNSVSVDLLGEE